MVMIGSSVENTLVNDFLGALKDNIPNKDLNGNLSIQTADNQSRNLVDHGRLTKIVEKAVDEFPGNKAQLHHARDILSLLKFCARTTHINNENIGQDKKIVQLSINKLIGRFKKHAQG